MSAVLTEVTPAGITEYRFATRLLAEAHVMTTSNVFRLMGVPVTFEISDEPPSVGTG